jgi:flagellar biosynthesis protein
MSEENLNNSDLAVALLYDGETTPVVTAKGRGELADQIISQAEEHGVPLHGDAELAALLSQIPLGDEIPESLYVAIAHVIAFAYLVSGKFPPGFEAQSE